MKVTPWPMKTSSSRVTPSQMKVWLEILQFLPTFAFFWISTKAPILVLSPISQPYRLMNFESLTLSPSFTSGAMHKYLSTDALLGMVCQSVCALARDDGARCFQQDFDIQQQGP